MKQRHMDFIRSQFTGDDYVKKRDQPRLAKQIKRVYDILSDHEWHSVDEIQFLILAATGIKDPECSISAQIRNLRKSFNSMSEIKTRRRSDTSLYEYKLEER